MKLRDVECQALSTALEDKKKDLYRANEELATQIRLIEAKASPDAVWTTAFSHGVSKSWDMMLPIMMRGIEKVKETIRNQEIYESIPRIDSVVEQRLKETGRYELIPAHQLEAKKRECYLKLGKVTDPNDVIRLNSYISILDWVLVSRNGN